VQLIQIVGNQGRKTGLLQNHQGNLTVPAQWRENDGAFR
jgi:hypothetical protein